MVQLIRLDDQLKVPLLRSQPFHQKMQRRGTWVVLREVLQIGVVAVGDIDAATVQSLV